MYSLKEGIEDGFLAPYKVVRVDIDLDLQGWRPTKGQVDKKGNLIEDRIYNQKDFDRTMVIDERTQLVAETITNYLKRTGEMDKTIVFCNDIDHADRMRRALINCNPEQYAKNDKYVMKITGDDEIGKGQLDNFINPKKAYPVIATTSELMTTGVDAKTCKLVVLDQSIQSMTKFKQIIGRGTRIDDKYNKLWFTILDFKKATELFADERFDGIPEKIIATTAEAINDPESNIDDVLNNPDANADENVDTNDNESDSGFDDPAQDHTGDRIIDGGDWTDPEKVNKYHVKGVKVLKVAERVQYYDSDGKLVTESFKDYTRKTLTKQFATLDEFVLRWNESERKQTIIDELASEGILWDALEQEVGKDLDPFDMICHVVFDQSALTRQERANNVKKRNYFTQYSEQAQGVLNRLLDKYADAGVSEVENLQTIKVYPFTEIGSFSEILKKGFGGRSQYDQAITELETAIYNFKPDKSA
jgi:type I restriction enzyme R subunit